MWNLVIPLFNTKSLEQKQTKEETGTKDKDDTADNDSEEVEEEEDWGELEILEDDPFAVPDSKDNIILDVGKYSFKSHW